MYCRTPVLVTSIRSKSKAAELSFRRILFSSLFAFLQKSYSSDKWNFFVLAVGGVYDADDGADQDEYAPDLSYQRNRGEKSNRFTTKPWLRWNLAPCLSPAKYAMRKPIHVMYASTPVALVEMLPLELWFWFCFAF